MLLNLFRSNLELKLKRVNNGINFGQSRILPLVKKMQYLKDDILMPFSARKTATRERFDKFLMFSKMRYRKGRNQLGNSRKKSWFVRKRRNDFFDTVRKGHLIKICKKESHG